MTFEVTPKIAEKIAVAQSLGQLSLSLRSIADNSADLERAVAAGDVKVPANASPAQEQQMLLAYRRPADRQQYDVHDRRRRVALPAPHRPQPSRSAPADQAMPAGHPAAAARSRSAPWSALRAAIMSPSFRWELAKMNIQAISRRARLGTALAALAVGIATVATPAPAAAQPKAYTSGTYRPSTQVLLSVGEGQMLNLPRSVSSVWTSNPEVADVYVNGPRQMNLFGKKAGEATVIATAADGSVVYGANVRVNQNISSINEILHQAMPDADISVTNVGQVAVLNGTVASPDDAAQAEMLVKAALNPGVDVSEAGAALNIVPVSRLKVATPLQVMLKVRVAEMNRSLVKQFGVNLLSTDKSGGTLFHIGRGNPGIRPAGTVPDGRSAGRSIRKRCLPGGSIVGVQQSDRRHHPWPVRQDPRPRHARHARPARE